MTDLQIIDENVKYTWTFLKFIFYARRTAVNSSKRMPIESLLKVVIVKWGWFNINYIIAFWRVTIRLHFASQVTTTQEKNNNTYYYEAV